MRVIGGTTILCVILGITAPAFAGQEHGGDRQNQAKPQQGAHEQERPAQPQQRVQPQQQQQRAQPQQQQQRSQPQQQPRAGQNNGSQQRAQSPRAAQNGNPQQQRQSQSRPQQQRAGQNSRPQRTQEQQRVQQSGWQQHRAQNWQTDHRSWQQRGGYNGYRIPDNRFRSYFGAGHGFRIGGLPFLMVGGSPRFQYGGYWFSVVDPWPAYWGDDWYDNDDVYVNYVDNGYYLYNRRYPGVGLAISVSF